jgi:hypothetical protein
LHCSESVDMQNSRGSAWDTPDEAETASTLDTIESEPSLPQPVLRSRPIAIRQAANEQDYDSDDSSHRDEDPDHDVIHRTNSAHRALSQQKQHQSLPSRLLLRAPHLGSIPTNEEVILRQRNIPDFRLPEQGTVDDDTTGKEKPAAYGSLRDSHMQGRFLDQPRSSFIGGDGGAAVPRHRGASASTVGSSNVMSSSAPIFSGLTVGERIQQQRKLQLALSNKNCGIGVTAAGGPLTSSTAEATASLPRKSSVLAELLGKMELDQATTPNPPKNTSPDSEHPVGFEPLLDGATTLSSSVTGLAILQGGLNSPGERWAAMQKHRSLPPISNSHDAPSSNERLSQSFSSPPSTGVSSYLAETGPPAAANTAMTNSFANLAPLESMYITPLQPTFATPFEAEMVDLPIAPAPPLYLPPFPTESPMTMEECIDEVDDQSDVEGAFDLDMD